MTEKLYQDTFYPLSDFYVANLAHVKGTEVCSILGIAYAVKCHLMGTQSASLGVFVVVQTSQSALMQAQMEWPTTLPRLCG